MHCLFLTPALDGPATGGTLYNRQLLAALQALQPPPLSLEQCTLAELTSARVAQAQQVWVDSLYLAELPALRQSLPPGTRLGLLLHYLPSLVGATTQVAAATSGAAQQQNADSRSAASAVTSSLNGRPVGAGTPRTEPTETSSLGAASLGAVSPIVGSSIANAGGASSLDARSGGAVELSAVELAAIGIADVIVTPSEYLRRVVLDVRPDKPCVAVMPGVEVQQVGGANERDGTALMICNVAENKGVLLFLHELAAVAPPRADFKLVVAGSLQLEAAYADRCLALCESDAWLRAHVRFVGSLYQHELFERLARASAFVSASRMESYGMALAEARALGTPILALPGGNIAQHVVAADGGELATTPHALAHALCALMTNPNELKKRSARARAAAKARPWQLAAREFSAALWGSTAHL